jgi:hypothetical protein
MRKMHPSKFNNLSSSEQLLYLDSLSKNKQVEHLLTYIFNGNIPIIIGWMTSPKSYWDNRTPKELIDAGHLDIVLDKIKFTIYKSGDQC